MTFDPLPDLFEDNPEANGFMQTIYKLLMEQSNELDKLTDLFWRVTGQAISEEDWKPLKKLRNKAVDSSNTLKFVKKHWEDPEETSQHLFGVPLNEARECFNNLYDKTPFHSEDKRMIISLLMRINLFLREKYVYTKNYLESTGSISQTQEKFNYKLEITEGKYDPSLVNEMLQNRADLNDALQYIVEAHLFEPYKATADYAFRGIYEQVRRLINFFEPTHLRYSRAPDTTGTGIKISEGRGKEKRQILLAFESQIPLGLIEDPNNSVHDWEALDSAIRHQVDSILMAGFLCAIVHNGEMAHYLEIDYTAALELKAKDPNDPTLPIIVHSSHLKAVNPSLFECLTCWILITLKHKDDQTPKELKAFQELYLSNNSTSVSSEILTLQKGFSKISSGDHQVFKVEASELSFTQLQSQEHFAMKIFDPKAYDANNYRASTASEEQVMINENRKILDKQYENEIECIRKINGDLEFNNCYLNNNPMFAIVKANDLVLGKCILSRFIETVPLTKDKKTRKKVEQQIKLLHEHKIVHNDIAKRNILYTTEGEVYLIDFESAIIDPEDEKEYEKDFRALNRIFA